MSLSSRSFAEDEDEIEGGFGEWRGVGGIVVEVVAGDEFELGDLEQELFYFGLIVGAELPVGFLRVGLAIAGNAQAGTEFFEAVFSISRPGVSVADDMDAIAFSDPAFVLGILVIVVGEVKAEDVDATGA